jgi:hypothetical protein
MVGLNNQPVVRTVIPTNEAVNNTSASPTRTTPSFSPSTTPNTPTDDSLFLRQITHRNITLNESQQLFPTPLQCCVGKMMGNMELILLSIALKLCRMDGLSETHYCPEPFFSGYHNRTPYGNT